MQVRLFTSQDASALHPLSLTAASHVLEKEGNVIGAAQVEHGICCAFCIAAPQRQKGYGTYFLKQLLRLCATQPFSVLIATPQQPAAGCALCQKVGLVPSKPLYSQANSTSGAQKQLQQIPFLAYELQQPVPRMDALAVAHTFLNAMVRPGAIVVDATAGNGHDTLFLAHLVGATGHVTALDFQQSAVERTNRLLAQSGCSTWACAICDSHANLSLYAEKESLDAVMFNLGYLPGGDHALFTQPEVSVPAMALALRLLRRGGVMTACLYAGGAQGTSEREAALSLFRALPPQQYSVLIGEFPHRSTAPIPVCIIKL